MKRKVLIILIIAAIIAAVLIVAGATRTTAKKDISNERGTETTTTSSVDSDNAGGNNNQRGTGRNRTNSKNQQLKEVNTANEAITKTITVDGVVAFNKMAKIYSTEDGKRIVKINVKVGDKVTQGQKLIEFDTDRLESLKNQYEEQKLTLEAAKLEIEKLKTTDNVKVMQYQNNIVVLEQQINEGQTNIKNNENQMVQVRASLVNTQESLKMTKELFAKGYSSQNEVKILEDKITEFQNTLSKLSSDNDNFRNVIETKRRLLDTDKKQIELETAKEKDPSVQLQILSKKQDIEKIKLTMTATEKLINNFKRYTEAEFSGVITNLTAEVGQSVAKGTLLLELSDNKDIIITANISEYDINKINVGDKGKITGDALDREYMAVVSRINPIGVVDSNGNTMIPIEMRFLGLRKEIRNNYKVGIEITKAPLGESLMVPLSSIIRNDIGKSFVMAIRKEGSGAGRARQVEINTGEIKGNMVEIIGLDPKYKVVEVVKEKKTGNKRTFMQSITGGPRGPGGR